MAGRRHGLPKAKGNLRLCDSWRGISLLAVPGKIMAKIVATRLSALTESILHEPACGFRPTRGTTDCIAVVRALLDLVTASPTGTLHCVFVDLRKAFDKVHREGLWLTLERHGVPPKLLRVTRALHEGMQAKVRAQGGLTEPFPVRTGVRQGCLIAPTLLNLFYAAALDVWRRGVEHDIELRFRIGTRLQVDSSDVFREDDVLRIDDTIYADDTTIFARTWETVKRKWHRYVDVIGRFGLTVSYTKTEVMTAGVDDTGGDRLAADPAKQHETGPWLRMEHVASFPMLGSGVQEDGGYEREVTARLKAAGAAYGRLKPTCFSCRHLSGRRKYKVFSVFVLTRLLYGAELWRLPPDDMHRLRLFHDRCLRTLAGLNRWTMYRRHVSDSDIRTMLGARPLQELVDRACLHWFGHVMRMSATQIPLQLISAQMPEWPIDTSQTPERHFTWYRYSHRCLQALRHFGISSNVAADAAQDAARWRARIRAKGWATRTAEFREGRAGRYGHASSSRDSAPPDMWPRPADLRHRAYRRFAQNLA